MGLQFENYSRKFPATQHDMALFYYKKQRIVRGVRQAMAHAGGILR